MLQEPLSLEVIALLKTQMLTNALQVFPAGLLVLRVVVDRHGQEAQLTGDGIQYRGRQPAGVAQEVAFQRKVQSCTAKPSLLTTPRQTASSCRSVLVKVKYLRRLSGSRVSGNRCSAASKRAAPLSCSTGTVIAVGGMGSTSVGGRQGAHGRRRSCRERKLTLMLEEPDEHRGGRHRIVIGSATVNRRDQNGAKGRIPG